MTPLDLLADLRRRGVTVYSEGGKLILEPAPLLSEADLEALRAAKPDLLALLGREEAEVLRVRLADLDRVLEVAVPWSELRLLVVPGCRRAEALRAADPNPGRVWCTCQLADLLLTGVTPRDAQAVAQAALAFDGSVRGVRPMGEPEDTPSWPPAPSKAARR